MDWVIKAAIIYIVTLYFPPCSCLKYYWFEALNWFGAVETDNRFLANCRGSWNQWNFKTRNRMVHFAGTSMHTPSEPFQAVRATRRHLLHIALTNQNGFRVRSSGCLDNTLRHQHNYSIASTLRTSLAWGCNLSWCRSPAVISSPPFKIKIKLSCTHQYSTTCSATPPRPGIVTA